MGLFENMRDFLEKFVKRNSALIVAFLSDFVKSLEICDLQNGLIDQIPKKLL